MVLDCFGGVGNDVGGYPVFAKNGSRTDVCFKRRKVAEDDKTKAHVDPTKLVSYLRYVERRFDEYQQWPSLGSSVTQEELTNFEYTEEEEVWNASLAAWSALVGTYLGNSTSVKTSILEDVLGPLRNSRSITYHEDKIQNYQKVFRAMREAAMSNYIRSRNT